MLDENTIISMNMEESWEAFKLYRRGEYKNEYKSIRFGINIYFDINEFIHGELKNKKKRGIYKIGRTSIKTEDFWTEIEERTTLMKECLLDMIPDKKITKSRR